MPAGAEAAITAGELAPHQADRAALMALQAAGEGASSSRLPRMMLRSRGAGTGHAPRAGGGGGIRRPGAADLDLELEGDAQMVASLPKKAGVNPAGRCAGGGGSRGEDAGEAQASWAAAGAGRGPSPRASREQAILTVIVPTVREAVRPDIIDQSSYKLATW